jgi:hypothetical protein
LRRAVNQGISTNVSRIIPHRGIVEYYPETGVALVAVAVVPGAVTFWTAALLG